MNNTGIDFQGIVESISMPLLILDREYKIVYSNPQSSSLLDFRRDRKTTPGLEDYFGDSVNEALKYLNILVQHKKDFSFEFDQHLYERPVCFCVRGNLIKQKNNQLYILLCFLDITAQKDIEKANKEELNRFRGLYENIPVGIYRTNPEGEILMSNPALIKMLGYESMEELADANLENLSPERQFDRDAFKKLIEKYNEVKGYITEWKSKNERSIVVEEYARAVRDKKGNILYYEGVVKDITLRKKAESKLIEREQRLKRALTIAKAGSWSYNYEKDTFIWSPEAFELFGYYPNEIIPGYSEFINLMHPDDRNSFFEAMNNHILKGDIFDIEIRFLKKDGEYIYTNCVGEATKDAKGKVKVFEGLIQNITEKKYSDELLRKSLEKLNILVENTPLAYIEWSADFTVMAWNNAAEKMFGYSREEAIGKHAFDLIIPAHMHKNITKVWKDSFYTFGQTQNTNENITRDGSKIICEWYNTQLTDSKGIVNGVASLARDITLEVKYKEEILEAKNRAQESDHLKSVFLANMSHEIRTPMNGIVGFSELLNKRELSIEKRQQFSRIIHEKSLYLLHLLDDILSISKIQAKQLKLSKNNFNLNEFLLQLLSFYKLELRNQQKSNIELNLEFGLDDRGSMINTDQFRLQQILNNLITNAIKFTEKGNITYGYEKQGNAKLLFYVTDTGIGIPKNKIPVIFDRFTQADYSTTKKYGGTGLGLAISKGLVSLLNGEIWVESIADKGSAFYFTIEYIKAQEEKVKDENIKVIANPSGETTKSVIMVVEDDQTNFLYLQEILKPISKEVILAESGMKAIELIRMRPDIRLILMDILLPELNGYDTTREILKLRKDLPIIAQTAYAMQEDKSKSIAAGCVDHLTKPFKQELLIDTIQKYLK